MNLLFLAGTPWCPNCLLACIETDFLIEHHGVPAKKSNFVIFDQLSLLTAFVHKIHTGVCYIHGCVILRGTRTGLPEKYLQKIINGVSPILLSLLVILKVLLYFIYYASYFQWDYFWITVCLHQISGFRGPYYGG